MCPPFPHHEAVPLTRYTTTIDRLNKQWREAVADSFGVQDPDRTLDGITPW